MGEIFVNGIKVKIKSPADAISYGISLLPEDRKVQGLLMNMALDFNLTLQILKDITVKGFLSSSKEQKATDEYVKAINIITPSHKQLVRNLSGGNQQKVIIAKWLANNSEIIVFDEPTRGIDVGAKAEIYKLMDEIASRGKSIIMISSELPELIGMSDRTIMMHESEIVGELMREEMDQEKILLMASSKKGEIYGN
jgi:ribose transport system ATP-binding protein